MSPKWEPSITRATPPAEGDWAPEVDYDRLPDRDLTEADRRALTEAEAAVMAARAEFSDVIDADGNIRDEGDAIDGTSRGIAMAYDVHGKSRRAARTALNALNVRRDRVEHQRARLQMYKDRLQDIINGLALDIEEGEADEE